VNALTLWQRLALVFVLLLLACFGAAAALQMAHGMRVGQQIEQQLLRRLASHLAADMSTLIPMGPAAAGETASLKSVVERLRVTNPGVDLYLLDEAGRIRQRYPDAEPLQRQYVALQPVRNFLAGHAAPILGDDPLHTRGSKVFSVAEKRSDGRTVGYLYAVLQGSAYDMAAAEVGRHAVIQTALWSIGLVTPLGLLAGLLSFRWVTRPLAQLTADVQTMAALTLPPPLAGEATPTAPARRPRDEILILRAAFDRLSLSNLRHWQNLAQQDQQRREWLAHISHDLRTPLATMQGYLETVLLKSELLSDEERQRYLRTALSESQGLSRLAQALLDLARLELGTVRPVPEAFSIVDLTQDVMHKLALSASARDKRLVPEFMPGVQAVQADIGMIERVLTNLIDNAIRHTPPGGEIRVHLRSEGDRVQVAVADQGPGIPAALRTALFAKASERLPGRDGGGLGLAVVHQMLQLHGSTIELRDDEGWGAIFVFDLPTQAWSPASNEPRYA
jgi:signal transduction histidine kinase